MQHMICLGNYFLSLYTGLNVGGIVGTVVTVLVVTMVTVVIVAAAVYYRKRRSFIIYIKGKLNFGTRVYG